MGAGTAGSPSPFWWRGRAGDSVELGFTSVEAGNLAVHAGPQSQVPQDRRRLEAAMGVPKGSLRFLNQVHSAEVLDAASSALEQPAGQTELDPSAVPTGDAWVCADGSVPLTIMVADCLPVLFYGQRAAEDPQHRVPVTAAAHAGRPGLLAGILENTVAAMQDRGAVRITAWIGPGACGACYEIPDQMVAEISPGRPAIASTTSWGTSALNLRAEAQAVLAQRGVTVEELVGCTIEDDSLFSHRRDPDRGRFAGVIWRPQTASAAALPTEPAAR
ncbi:laccase domain-containing protein [Nesterenkonia sp. E16_7]|nr:MULTISPECIES: polyphenol oxidase family protein [unclassified Nesterenkonia]MBO0595111.1 laccase domain-containing protein [Nesterenkonia sp. E16_10]MBO0598766.1 laccase domain-containing protein [Nesterenkonia sp. E16_7]